MDVSKIELGEIVHFRQNGYATVKAKMVQGDKVTLWFPDCRRVYNLDGSYLPLGEHQNDIIGVVK